MFHLCAENFSRRHSRPNAALIFGGFRRTFNSCYSEMKSLNRTKLNNNDKNEVQVTTVENSLLMYAKIKESINQC